MKNVLRFVIVLTFGVVCLTAVYLAFPTVVWWLGGNFKLIASSPLYAILGGVIAYTCTIIIIEEIFNVDLTIKSRIRKF